MTFLFYLVNFLFLSGLIFLFWRQQKQGRPALQKAFFPALACRLLGGILYGLFYRYYYGSGDTLEYQSQSLVLYDYFLDSPLAYLRLWLSDQFESETVRTSMIYVWYSNSYFMVILLSLLNIFTGGQYFLNSLYFSLFSFFGAWRLVAALEQAYPQWGRAAAGAFLFFPSVVFWASGITKEAIYLGALCWFFAGTLALANPGGAARWRGLASLGVAAWLLWKIKFYFAAVAFPLAFSYVLLSRMRARFPQLAKARNQLFIFCSMLLLSGLAVLQLHQVFSLEYFLRQLMRSYELILAASAGKPVLWYPHLQPQLGSVLAHAPLAAFNAVLRPFVWEGEGWLYKLAGLENLLVGGLLLAALPVLVRRKSFRPEWFMVLLLVYSLVVAALIGLSTPNVGSLSRYKTAFQPFLVFLLLAACRWPPASRKRR